MTQLAPTQTLTVDQVMKKAEWPLRHNLDLSDGRRERLSEARKAVVDVLLSSLNGPLHKKPDLSAQRHVLEEIYTEALGITAFAGAHEQRIIEGASAENLAGADIARVAVTIQNFKQAVPR